MASFTLTIEDADEDALAGELERIASMIREGFTAGDVRHGGEGWWNIEGSLELGSTEA